MKTGLILEGGAMRGLFTAGVLDVFTEKGIKLDGMVGVSAGAVFGCNFKSGQAGRTLRYNVKYCKDPRYCSYRSLIKTGDLYGADFCYNKIPFELDVFDNDAFKANPMEFHVVCTDIITGEPVYKKLDECDRESLEWMRASASMPLFSRVVEAGGRKMLDGGTADSIPIKYFESIGYDRNIVVLTQPKGYVKQRNKLLPLVRATLGKYPGICRAMENRHEMYNETIAYIEEKERKGEIIVIRPEFPLPTGRIEHNAQNLIEAHRIGVDTARKRLSEIAEFLSE